jgi:glycosyltransferase involved in cell wall biosynthesis
VVTTNIEKNLFKAVWVNPNFSHYRIPVYKALSDILGENFTIIYSEKRIVGSVQQKINAILGRNALGLRGEHIVSWKRQKTDFANTGYTIPLQPGLLKAIAKEKPDIIISEGFFQWTPASLLVKCIRRIPLVITYERTKHTERNAGYLRILYRRLIVKRTDAICCNGVLSKEYCTDVLGMPPDRIVTGAMAADTDLLASRCARILETDISALEQKYGLVRPVFLYVGRLIRLKGLRELLAGWELYVRNSRSPVSGTLLIVGDGPERSILEETVRSKKMAKVIFAGAVNYDDIALYYRIADVFVMPTLEDNWSLVVPEAMACGKPVLCSQYNGCWPELIQQDINGWTFDPFNAEEVAHYLAICNEGRERLAHMGKESLSIVQKHSPRHAAEAIMEACKVAREQYDSRKTYPYK